MDNDVRPHAVAAQRSAEASCLEVVGAVYRAIDVGRATEAVPQYTEDAVVQTARGTAEGREAVAALMAAREANVSRVTRHDLSAVRVTVSGTEARLIAALSVYVLSEPATSTDPEAVAALDIRLRQTEAGWRIAHHVSTRLTDEERS